MNDKVKVAIGATIGAVVAWGAVFGVGDGTAIFGIDQTLIEQAVATVGAIFGSVVAIWKNKKDGDKPQA